MSRLILMLALLLTAPSLSGCANDPRQAVEGTVTLDGQPLPSGTLTFRPAPGTTSPSAGAEIESGRFVLPREKGPFAGEFLVEITAWRETGRSYVDPDMGAEPIPVGEQYLPDRYNAQTELTATIRADEPNRLEFQLRSNPE